MPRHVWGYHLLRLLHYNSHPGSGALHVALHIAQSSAASAAAGASGRLQPAGTAAAQPSLAAEPVAAQPTVTGDSLAAAIAALAAHPAWHIGVRPL